MISALCDRTHTPLQCLVMKTENTDPYLDMDLDQSVRVVHGKGTGALRKGIHNYLRRQKHVADFHLAEFGEGDAGVTIVTFKK